MYEHFSRTVIRAHDTDPAGSDPVAITLDTDKRKEGHHNTATLSISYPNGALPTVKTQLTAAELDVLAAGAATQAAILRGGVGR